jgi:hypothetical protein
MAEEREIYLMPRITEAAFPELLELMVGEEDFPRTFREWTALWERRRLMEERDHGYDVVFIDVIPASFASYCELLDFPTDWRGLGQYIAVLAGQ